MDLRQDSQFTFWGSGTPYEIHLGQLKLGPAINHTEGKIIIFKRITIRIKDINIYIVFFLSWRILIFLFYKIHLKKKYLVIVVLRIRIRMVDYESVSGLVKSQSRTRYFKNHNPDPEAQKITIRIQRPKKSQSGSATLQSSLAISKRPSVGSKFSNFQDP